MAKPLPAAYPVRSNLEREFPVYKRADAWLLLESAYQVKALDQKKFWEISTILLRSAGKRR